MYKIEELLVIVDYDFLDQSNEYVDPETRKRWGVIASPQPILDEFTKFTVYCLPLEWKEELEKSNIQYEQREIKILLEDLI